MTAPSGCTWTASSSALPWATITSGASGSSNGTVNYSIAANPNSGGRSGTLTIAGQSFTITQAGQGCQISLNPSSANLTYSGTTGSTFAVNVSGADCQWTSSISPPSWLTITSGNSGTGSGSVTYAAAGIR